MSHLHLHQCKCCEPRSGEAISGSGENLQDSQGLIAFNIIFNSKDFQGSGWRSWARECKIDRFSFARLNFFWQRRLTAHHNKRRGIMWCKRYVTERECKYCLSVIQDRDADFDRCPIRRSRDLQKRHFGEYSRFIGPRCVEHRYSFFWQFSLNHKACSGGVCLNKHQHSRYRLIKKRRVT